MAMPTTTSIISGNLIRWSIQPLHGTPSACQAGKLLAKCRTQERPGSVGRSSEHRSGTSFYKFANVEASRAQHHAKKSPVLCKSTTTSSHFVAPPKDEETQKLITEVKEALERNHPSLPVGTYGRDDEAMIWWFLRDRKMDVGETVSKLAKTIRWRSEFGVAELQLADLAEEASTGKAYLHEHLDKDGKPVIVVVAAKHLINSERLLASQQLCVLTIEQALGKLPPSEEKLTVVVDLRGFSAKNADLAFVGFLVNVFFNYYPKRLHKALFVEAPPIFQPVWRLTKPMLKSYASLVVFCSADDVRTKHFQPGLEPPTLSV